MQTEDRKTAKCAHSTKIYSLSLCRNCYERDLKKRNPEYAKRQRAQSKLWRSQHADYCRQQDKVRWQNLTLKQRQNETKKKRMWALKANYGITPAQYDQFVLEQQSKCAICKQELPLLVDHNHLTMEVRGLLCKACNFIVGTVEQRGSLLKSAGEYLLRTQGGTKFDQEKLRYELIPPYPLSELARVYTIGGKKYLPDNWREGLDKDRILGALLRHTEAIRMGELIDQKDGQLHASSIAWCAFALMEYESTHPEFDDRPQAIPPGSLSHNDKSELISRL